MKTEYKMTDSYPQWINVDNSFKYEDRKLLEIISFFVIHSPCPGQSWQGITLEDRGWKPKPWNSKKYLKDKLDKAIFGDDKRQLKMVDKKADFSSAIDAMNLDDDFFKHLDEQRMAFVKVSKTEVGNEYMSLFYHIRNALAHGRFAIFPSKNDDYIFVMEDGALKSGKEKFELNARIVINESSLLKMIEILKSPPLENDYTEDVMDAIRNGKCTKSQIKKEIGFDDDTFEKTIEIMKKNNLIVCEKKKWRINE